ncbi:MAG: autotransporter-associated beta strand repeat-containing protein [Rariglobus sp.]
MKRTLSFLTLAGLTCLRPATAETLHWGGGTSGTSTFLSTASNWLENTAPTTTSDLIISGNNGTDLIPTLIFGADIAIRSLSADNANGEFGANGLRIGPTTSSSSTTARIVTFGTAGIPIISATNNAALTIWRFTATASQTLNLGYTGLGDIYTDASSSVTIGTANITGTGGINKTGAGLLTLGSTNAFTGGLTISAGVLSTDSSLNLGAKSAADAVVINGGTLRFTNSTGITNTNTRGFQVGSSTGTIEVQNGAVRFGTTNTFGNVSGQDGILRKTGTGILSFENGTNTTHTGGTLLEAGSLVLALNSTLGGNTSVAGLTAASGTTFRGSGTVNGNSSFANGAVIDIATMGGSVTVSNAIGTLSFNGNLALGDVSLLFDLGAPGTSDLISLTSGHVLTIGNGTFDLTNFTFTASGGLTDGTYTLISSNQTIVGSFGGTVTGTLNGADVTLVMGNGGTTIDLLVTGSAIPEPSSVALLAGAFVLAGASLRRSPHVRR